MMYIYGTIRFFTEDVLESVHVLVNKHNSRFAKIERAWSGNQNLQSLQLDKQDKYATREKE